MLRWVVAGLLGLMTLLVATIGGMATQNDARSAFKAVSEGKYGAIAATVMVVLFAALVAPEIRGWFSDQQHRKEQPRGEGMLNISVTHVTNYGALQHSTPQAGAWFVTDEMVITNHTKSRMLLRPFLQVGIKTTSNHGAPLSLYPRDCIPPSVGIALPNNVSFFPHLIDLAPKGCACGRFVFALGANDQAINFDSNLSIHMTGDVKVVYFDVFSDKQRIGGWGSRLRRLA